MRLKVGGTMITVNKYFELIAMTTASYSEFAKKNNINYPILAIYESLYNKNEATASEISNSWGIPKQTLHSSIKELLKKELIIIEENPNDKRSKLLVLTEKGKREVTPIVEKLNKSEGRALKVLTNEESEQLYNLTQKLTKRLIKEVKNG